MNPLGMTNGVRLFLFDDIFSISGMIEIVALLRLHEQILFETINGRYFDTRILVHI